ncbi:unnamed protein product, partial [Choristocarpus tenellus]
MATQGNQAGLDDIEEDELDFEMNLRDDLKFKNLISFDVQGAAIRQEEDFGLLLGVASVDRFGLILVLAGNDVVIVSVEEVVEALNSPGERRSEKLPERARVGLEGQSKTIAVSHDNMLVAVAVGNKVKVLDTQALVLQGKALLRAVVDAGPETFVPTAVTLAWSPETSEGGGREDEGQRLVVIRSDGGASVTSFGAGAGTPGDRDGGGREKSSTKDIGNMDFTACCWSEGGSE